ncbi:MAG: hypothetical protein ACXWQE_14930, partial [Bdellovibrionales bacterium]
MLDRESLALAFIILAAFPAQIWLSQGKLSEEKKYLVPPPQSIEHFTFGFGPSIADSLWLRWVQDSDTCQSYGEYKERPALPSEDSKNFLKNPRHKVCDYSWGFQMLDAISKIQPRFKEVYSMGLIILAVMVEDYKGSTILYNRGLKEFPDDWRLNYQAAFHFLGDEEDLPRAARLLEHA